MQFIYIDNGFEYLININISAPTGGRAWSQSKNFVNDKVAYVIVNLVNIGSTYFSKVLNQSA